MTRIDAIAECIALAKRVKREDERAKKAKGGNYTSTLRLPLSQFQREKLMKALDVLDGHTASQ